MVIICTKLNKANGGDEPVKNTDQAQAPYLRDKLTIIPELNTVCIAGNLIFAWHQLKEMPHSNAVRKTTENEHT